MRHRPPSGRRPYSVYLTPEEAAEADRQALSLGLLSEKGEPSRSALFRHWLNNTDRPEHISVEELRRWAEGFRHAADNRHYHLDPETARETASRFDRAADQIEELMRNI